MASGSSVKIISLEHLLHVPLVTDKCCRHFSNILCALGHEIQQERHSPTAVCRPAAGAGLCICLGEPCFPHL